MKALRDKRSFRSLSLLVAAALAVGLSGCGRPVHPNGVSQGELSDGAEPYFWTGAVTYQVQISRQLNPYDTYDVQYLSGLKDAQHLAPQQFWFGVFLWAKNQSGHPARTADRFEIVDSAGNVYRPTPLPNTNPYAWTQQTLSPNGIEPMAAGAAASSPTGGALVLFKLNQSVYSNRPLTLKIFAPGSRRASNVSLDL
ncbi:MAG TPA: hypothetical protein VFN36_00305 [Solirubrobacteraceae bacterium]|nr:hypothetical protein [Solirubrobacteraceae bacterium]